MFFEFDARDEARMAAETEWDAYVIRAGDTRGAWETGHKKQWSEDLGKQHQIAEDDLAVVEIFAAQKRDRAGVGGTPEEGDRRLARGGGRARAEPGHPRRQGSQGRAGRRRRRVRCVLQGVPEMVATWTRAASGRT